MDIDRTKFSLSLTINDWNLIIDSLSRTEALAQELKGCIFFSISRQNEILNEGIKQSAESKDDVKNIEETLEESLEETQKEIKKEKN